MKNLILAVAALMILNSMALAMTKGPCSPSTRTIGGALAQQIVQAYEISAPEFSPPSSSDLRAAGFSEAFITFMEKTCVWGYNVENNEGQITSTSAIISDRLN